MVGRKLLQIFPLQTKGLFYLNPIGVWLHVVQNVHYFMLLNIPMQSSEAAESVSLGSINPIIVGLWSFWLKAIKRHKHSLFLNSWLLDKSLERSSRRTFLLESTPGTTVYFSPLPSVAFILACLPWPNLLLSVAVLSRDGCFHRGTS